MNMKNKVEDIVTTDGGWNIKSERIHRASSINHIGEYTT